MSDALPEWAEATWPRTEPHSPRPPAPTPQRPNATPPATAPRATGHALRSAPRGAVAIAEARSPGSAPLARVRGSLAHRLLQNVLIPSAGLLVLAWGWVGVKDPPPWVTAPSDQPLAIATTGTPVTTALAAAGVATPSFPARAAPPSSPAAASAVGTPSAAGSPGSVSPSPLPRASPTPSPVAVAGCALPATLPPPSGPSRLVTIAVFDLRREPGLSCTTLGTLQPGTIVRPRSGIVVADAVRWILVEADGRTGWIVTALLQEPDPAALPTPAPTATASATDEPPVVTGCAPPDSLPVPDDTGPLVTTAPLNLRTGPGLACGIIRVLEVGAEVVPRGGPVRADGRLWFLVAVDGTTGWAAADFLREAGDGGGG